jgi:hypothetical protein
MVELRYEVRGRRGEVTERGIGEEAHLGKMAIHLKGRSKLDKL